MKNKYQYLSRIMNAYVFKRRDSNLSFWHTPLAVNRLERTDVESVGRYPMNFAAKADYDGYMDKDGVVRLNYHGNIGVQYNPNAVAQKALGHYEKYLDGCDEGDGDQQRQAFLMQANYFLGHGREVKDGVLLWEYNFPFEMRNYLESPWRSALAQGQAISVLVRAHGLTGDDRYAKAAQKGYNAFRYLAKDHEGGVLDKHDGEVWLEEYIVEPHNHVLNGFIWAMWGVREYAVYFDDQHAKQLWNDCLDTLKSNLHRYDLGFWTTYDWPHGRNESLPTMPSSLYYQRLHAVQMDACYNLTGDVIFKEYGERWRGYLNSRWRKFISRMWKTYFKLRHF